MPDNSLGKTARILQESTWILNSSIDILDESIQDVPRLLKVLETEKLYGVVPEMEVDDARKGADSEISPQIDELRELAEKKLARLRRKKVGLENQVQLLKGRLESAEQRSPRRVPHGSRESLDTSASGDSDMAVLRSLRSKSDRLKFTLSRYKLQKASAKLSAIPPLTHQRN